MSMDKIGNVKLETTAEYQRISGLNVQFWNQDKGTAVLQFNITRNNYPLGLSEENVKVFIALESGDSFLVDDKLDYLDELNGIVSYTIPNEFMRVASNVKGQVYVTTLDEEEVVVQRQFTFNVANDLIADLPSEDKIREIKYFSDMREEVSQMMEKLNYDFEHMNDYITQVDQKTQDGITALTNLINTKQKAYNDNHTAKLKEINDTASSYSTKFDDDKQYIDEKTEAFKESVNGSGLVTTGEATNWQKQKLSQDDGTTLYDVNLKIDFNDSEQLSNLKVGTRYVVKTLNTPEKATSNNGWLTKYDRGEVKQVEFRPYSSSQVFVKRFYKTWLDWELITPDYSVIETIQESQNKANTAESNAKVYTDEKIGAQHTVLFNGEVSDVGSKVNLTGDLFDYNMIVVTGETPGGIFSDVVLPAAIKTNIIIQKVNLRDSDGEFIGIYELKLEITNNTTLTIINDISYDVINSSSSGPNRNAFTINRIEGWK